MKQLEKIKEILDTLKQDTITPKEIESFLKFVLETIKNEKSTIIELTEKQKEILEGYVVDIENKLVSLDGWVDEKIENTRIDFTTEIESVKNLLQEIRKIKLTPGKDGVDGKDGRDGVDGYTPVKGIDYRDGIDGYTPIRGVDYNDGRDGSPDTGEQIVEKINNLEIDEQYQIDASHIKNLPKQIQNNIGGVIARNIYQMGDVALSGLTDGQVLMWDGTNKRWNNETPAATGIDGTMVLNRIPYGLDADTLQTSANLTFDGSLETITADSLGSNTSDTKGLALVNTTNATSILNQVSPAIKFKGNGWKTNATAGSQSVEGRIYLNVLTGTANPQGAMRIQTALNGGSFSNHVFDVWSDGIVSIEEGGPFPSGYAKLQIPSINITSGGSIRLAESKGGSGQFLGSDGTKTIWATPTLSLSNGSATTANGTAVDLGGTQGANVTITNGSTYFFRIESSSNKAFFLLDPTNKIYQLGDAQSDTNGNFLTIDDNSNKSYFDRASTHDGRLGIMTDSPLSTNDTLGSQGLAYRKITEDSATATEADYTCSIDNGASNWTFNLPDPTGCLRRIYVVKRYDSNSTGTVQVTTSGGNLQNPEDGTIGSTTYNLQAWGAGNPFYSVMWQSNGTDWEAIK